ncbi:ATP-binding protein [Agrobacterium tumefaciens]|uniref:ATP-binding protein n=1 Tax=Agrobacterium tumefaciens TaxID=358 RepID=UPI00045ADEA9|nr:ATP-binding protein [Agrobacterium tumefaciens]CDN95979.1 DNA mismatch repair enzyme (Predicted ATPase) [Agrobacterium tumefaciens]
MKYITNSRKRKVDATPFASSLIEGHRDFGYSLETAIADIIDNSITANAKNVNILVDSVSDEPTLAIRDDGVGMTEDELIDAMRLGSKNPLHHREGHDLGRFGLGLKSASFSQCRRLCVVSVRDGNPTTATWDLDDIGLRNNWELDLNDEVNGPAGLDLPTEHGTVVIWSKLDRLSGGIIGDAARRSEHLNAALSDAERYIRLVFHRFLSGRRPKLCITLNGRRLRPIDPLANGHAAAQIGPEEVIPLPDGDVVIQCVTLPHHKMMAEADWIEVGGPEGHLRSQGLYIYRGNRLIIAGGWLGIARQTELTKLCRVRVDIPNSMDALWKIDVKKASAQLPPAIGFRLRRIIESFLGTSRRVYQRRGQRLVDPERHPLWSRISQDGKIVFRPNLEHPAFVRFASELPEQFRAGFETCLQLLGSGLPIEALHADLLGNAEALFEDEADEQQIKEMVNAVGGALQDAGIPADRIKDVLRGHDFFRKNWASAETLIDDYIEDSE